MPIPEPQRAIPLPLFFNTARAIFFPNAEHDRQFLRELQPPARKHSCRDRDPSVDFSASSQGVPNICFVEAELNRPYLRDKQYNCGRPLRQRRERARPARTRRTHATSSSSSSSPPPPPPLRRPGDERKISLCSARPKSVVVSEAAVRRVSSSSTFESTRRCCAVLCDSPPPQDVHTLL